jgi:protein-L-isoaspartate(D-aspartate) O-methyltransferase
MIKVADSASEADEAAKVRDGLVDKLVVDKMITSPVVERAFRTVPRHLFVPEGTSLEVAYNDADSVAVKRDADGVIISSTSAPFIQARMIEQAGLGPGMSVLEIGSGGYYAALLAEVVGPSGRVVSVDIDQDVVDLARARLAATGYGERVTVEQVDAEHPVGEAGEPVDAIVVTVGAWDVAPAWLDQLADGGTIVVPLRMNGVSRSIGFRHAGDHLVSTSAEVCGFVPMQGDGAHDERVFVLPDANGHAVKLRFDGVEVPVEMSRLDGVLATERVERWSGVTIKNGVSFADLHLWFASFLPGFCKLAADDGTAVAAERGSWFPFGVVRGDSFAYLAVRKTPDGGSAEFGGWAYGRSAENAAMALVESIQEWDRRARGHAEPTFAYWPDGTDRPEFGTDTAIVAKTHGLVSISWPSLS